MTSRQTGNERGGAAPIDLELWERRIFPAIRALIRFGYFSFDVEGLEHVPREGPVVFAQNHAGWFALDALVLTLAVVEAVGPKRIPRFATQDAVFDTPVLGALFSRGGAVPASSFRRPERLPPDIDSFGIFPEGVRGNCKPFWQAYRMREWSRGFVRLAVARDATIVPAAILGGEECLPNAWTVELFEPIVGSIFGLPLSLVPLPTRWKVIFHAPVRVPASGRGALLDASLHADVARQVQRTVQRTLDREAARYPLARISSLAAEVERWVGRGAPGSRARAAPLGRREPTGASHRTGARVTPAQPEPEAEGPHHPVERAPRRRAASGR